MFKLIPAEDSRLWNDSVARCGPYDVYHSAEYHLLEKIRGAGEPFLFFFQHKDDYAALPFLKRPVSEVSGLEDSPYYDASSAYGYPGPISSINENDPSSLAFSKLFQKELSKFFDQDSIISFFCRFNPISPNIWLLNGLCDIERMGKTVALDLNLSNQKQLLQTSNSLKRNIRKAKKSGILIEQDSDLQRIDIFMRIYYETMDRVAANPFYYFPEEYFKYLRDKFNHSTKMFISKFDNKVISASIFLASNKNIHYHLSGTSTEYLKLNASEYLLDEVRLWSKNNGYSWLHLGGGYHSKGGSLYDFKARFSKIRFVYYAGRTTINPEICSNLSKQRDRWLRNKGLSGIDSSYFPQYRAQSE